MTAWGMANLDPRGLIGRIYEGDYHTLLHIKHISCGPHGLRKEDRFKFYHYKSMGVACLGRRGLIGRIYVGDH